MANLKKCDRCGTTTEAWQTTGWDGVKLGSTPNQVPMDLCPGCADRLKLFLGDSSYTIMKFPESVILQEPAEVPKVNLQEPAPIVLPPVDGAGETRRQMFVDNQLPGEEPATTLLDPGPPIHIPRGVTITTDDRPRCPGDGRGHNCGHLVTSHGESGCMVLVKGQYCPCGKESEIAKGLSWPTAKEESTEADPEPAF